MEDRLNEHPKGWVWTTVGSIGEVVTGTTPSKSNTEYYGSSHPFYKPTDLNDGYYVRKSGDGLSEKGIKQARLLPSNSVLVTCIGATIGKTGFIRKAGASNQQINAIVTEKGILPEFIYFICVSPQFQKSIFDNASATTLPILNKSKFEILSIPLPPLPEQHRIVGKIEELFTRLDAGVEALKKIKAQLKRYRQAVLKYAFEGKLTQEWRKVNKRKIEPVFVLLERIKEQRKKEVKGRVKELPPVITSELAELPEGWEWTRVGNVATMIQYGTSEKANEDSNGIPAIRMGNILDGKIVFDKLKYFPKEWPQLRDLILQGGDVLFNRTNSMELVGKTAVYKNYYPKAVFASYIIRVKLREDSYNPELLSFFINSFYGRKYITSIVSQQVGQANVNGTKLSLMPIPLPSLPEQQKIVEEIESRLSIADNMEKVVEQSLKQSDRLRRSILKQAFKGKLVPQDPTDEPAEKLLDRIKEEKAKREENGKGKKHRNKNSKQMELI